MKLKYNPFKLAGSWIGGILAYLFVVASIQSIIGAGVYPFLNLFLYLLITSPIQSLITFGVGFLIGWGIHVFLIKKKIIRR